MAALVVFGAIACFALPTFAQDTQNVSSAPPSAGVPGRSAEPTDEPLPPITIAPQTPASSAPPRLWRPPPRPSAQLRIEPEPDDHSFVYFGQSTDDGVAYECNARCTLSVEPGEYTVRFRRRASFWSDTWTDNVSRSIRVDSRGLVVRRDHPGWPWLIIVVGAATAVVGLGLLLPAILPTHAGPRDPSLIGLSVGLIAGGLVVEIGGSVARVQHSISAEVPSASAVSRGRVRWGITGMSVAF